MEQQDNRFYRAYRGVVQKAHQAVQFEKVRFALVGVANTATDFIVLLSLMSVWGMAAMPANIISTTCALIVSFTLNKKAVFPNGKPMTARMVALFVAVTLAGIWLVQTLIMSHLLELFKAWTGVEAGMMLVALIVAAKTIGIIAGSVWNYLWYSRLIFKKPTRSKA